VPQAIAAHCLPLCGFLNCLLTFGRSPWTADPSVAIPTQKNLDVPPNPGRDLIPRSQCSDGGRQCTRYSSDGPPNYMCVARDCLRTQLTLRCPVRIMNKYFNGLVSFSCVDMFDKQVVTGFVHVVCWKHMQWEM
jgi:hypothetical protein